MKLANANDLHGHRLVNGHTHFWANMRSLNGSKIAMQQSRLKTISALQSQLILVTTSSTGGGVLFFQAGVLFSIENASFGHLVANLCTF